MARLRIGSTKKDAGGGKAGKVGATLFLSIFAAAGLFFTGMIAWAWLQAAGVYFWDEARCVIESSEVNERPGAGDEAYRLVVSYRYTHGGKEYVGSSIDPQYSGSDNIAKTQRLRDRYAAGRSVRCRVDPDEPARAYLRRPSLWFGFAILLPLVFVAVGGGGMYLVWRRQPIEASDESPGASISQRARRKKVFSWGVISWIFLLAGLGFSLFFVLPAVKVVQARSWSAVPCEILHSAVESHSSDDGVTYSVDVLYRYELDGREYKSSRYRFLGGSSSGYEGKRKVVDRLPRGTRTTCYVNPDDPYDAVLDRGFSWMYLIALLPLVFVAVGAPGAAASIYRGLKKVAVGGEPRVAAPEGLSLDFAPEAENPYLAKTGPLELEPEVGPLTKFLGIVFVCLFWNGIVGVFLWNLIQEWKGGDPSWFLALFLVPFVLVGLALLVSVPYQLLALANPRPHLSLDPGSVAAGGRARLDWRFSRAAGRLRGLRIVLEGREQATYRRGTDTVTDKEVFAELEILRTDSAVNLRQGSVHFDLPTDTMHSFAADHNKIVWVLKLAGEIRYWPDVLQEFEIHVVPPQGKWT